MTQSKDKKAERKIWLRFFGIAGGLVLLLTGYISLFVLQSSIKIENGLGAEAAAISYTVSLLFSLLLTPMFLRLVGVRKATILSEFCYIFYVACNFYPKRWLMMIASIVVGVAEAVLWIPIGMIPGYFGREFQQESKSAGLAGILFALLCLNQVIGNIFSF
uniref:Protein unc-93 homolog A n=1 Tax=Ciona savignyi TaxID=51511 RepID=H2ZI26_CIOSA